MRIYIDEFLLSDIFFQFIDEIFDPLVIFDPDLIEIIYANKKAYELFGERFNFSEILEENEYLNFIKLIKDCHAPEKARVMSFKRTDSSKGLISFDLFPLSSENQRFVLCCIRDITDEIKKREERRRRNAQMILKDKMRSIELLTSNISHEISNICNFVQGNLKIINKVWQDTISIVEDYGKEQGSFLLGGIPSEEVNKVIPKLTSALIDGVNRIKETIEEFKKYLKSAFTSEITVVDINEIVKRVYLILSHRISLHTDTFVMNLDWSVPKIKGNFQKIEYVVINIIMNALQALQDKNKAVYVKTGYEETKRCVFIEVEDEGEGISEENMKMVFEPFFSTKSSSGGTGLGLYLSKAIVEEHRGEIIINSCSGKGTRVRVYLPV